MILPVFQILILRNEHSQSPSLLPLRCSETSGKLALHQKEVGCLEISVQDPLAVDVLKCLYSH